MKPAPLLITKFHVPAARSRLVSRPRLCQRLDETLQRDHALVLISAPAGFGKTTLLSDWLQNTTRPATWLSLDAGDNDLTGFLTYLQVALQKIYPAAGQGLTMARPATSTPTVEPLLTALINDLSAASQPGILVLDDYHVIEAPTVHEAIAFVIEHAPPHLTVIIAGRTDPPLPLARLRARARLIELRTADLSFTATEAAAFLNEVMSLDLSATDVLALEERTEGWIAGLQLAALSLQGRADRSSFVRAFTGSHRFVLDYLIEEVLDRQPIALQDFLLTTSILTLLTAPLCDALTNRTDSQAVLQQLEQDNLFIIPLDDERRWYRFHHLFADLLRARLLQAHPELVVPLRQRASEWLEHEGLIVEAVMQAQAAKDLNQVVRLIEAHGPALVAHGEFNTLGQWLDALPPHLMEERPWLCIQHARLHVHAGQFEIVEQLLHTAEEVVKDTNAAEARRLRGHIAAIRCEMLLLTAELDQAKVYAQEALSNLSSAESQDLMIRSLTAKNLAYILRLNYDLTHALEWINEAVAGSQHTGDLHDDVSVLCELALLQRERGELRQAASAARQALHLAEEHARSTGRILPAAGEAHLCLGEILREWNRLPEALQHFQRAVEIDRGQGQPEVIVIAYLSLSRGLLAAGDIDGALTALHAARQAAQSFPPLYVIYIGSFEANIFLAQGNLSAATRWLEESRATGADDLLIRYRYIGFTFAHVLAAQGKFAPASTLLRDMQQALAGKGAIWAEIMIWTILSTVLYRQERVELALSALERALTLAEPEGFMRAFLDEGPPLRELLERTATRGKHLEYVARLLGAFAQDEARQAKIETAQRSIEPLTDREAEVLRLLAIGQSNAAIAQTLVIAPETVKKHLKNIYAKLDVHSRVEAVNRAREIRLL